MDTRLNVGVLLFNNMTMLDAFGPLQVCGFVPQFHVFTFARETASGGGDVLPQRDSLHTHLDTHPPQARA